MDIVRVTDITTLNSAIAGANVFTFTATGKMIPGIQLQDVNGRLQFGADGKYLLMYAGMNSVSQPRILNFMFGDTEQLRCFSAEPHWTVNKTGKEFPVLAAQTTGNKIIIVALETCEPGKEPVGNCGYIHHGKRESAVLMDDGAKRKYHCPTAVVTLLPGESLEVLTPSVAYKLENVNGVLKNTPYNKKELHDLAERIDWRAAVKILSLVKSAKIFDEKYAGLWTVGFSLAGEILQSRIHTEENLQGFARIALHAQSLGFRLPPIVGDVLTKSRNRLGTELEQQLELAGMIRRIDVLPRRIVKETGENWTLPQSQKQAPQMPAPLLNVGKSDLAAMFA